MNAILVPGRPDKDEHYDASRPSNSEDHWFSWLKRQLILRDIHAVAIEPPFPYRPRYREWKREFERFDLHSDTILVGHSCGGGFLVRYLSENKNVRVGKVFLVAPWMNPDDNPVSDTADFFKFDIDPDIASRTSFLTVFVSRNDDASVLKTVEILQGHMANFRVRWFEDKAHFTENDLGSREFLELLQAILDA